jgi:phosphoenolpyruvate carboxykinase (ATP)
MPIALTRAAVTAVLDGSLDEGSFETDPVFGFAVPRAVPGIPASFVHPRQTWPNTGDYDAMAARLAKDLRANLANFEHLVPASVRDAGPGSGTR